MSPRKELLFIPGPVTVSDTVLRALARPLVDHRGPAFAALQERVCGRLRPIVGTAGSIVLLGSSGTGGLEAVVGSLFMPGDRLLACPIGAFGERLVAIARAYGLDVEVLETPWGASLDPARLAERLRADPSGRIAGILLTQNETSTGVAQELDAVSRAMGEHPALRVVDAVSGMGATEFRMDAWRLDAVVCAPQKAFAAPPGLAMVALSDRTVKRARTAKALPYYFSLEKALDFARVGQTPWTPPVSLVNALDAALENYESEGAPAVWRRHATYASAIRAAAAALQLELLSHEGAHSNTVVALKARDGMDVDALLRTLRDERGVVLSGGQQALKGKIVRIGTMGDISQTDVLGMIGALEIAMLEQDLGVHIGTGVQAALRVFLESDEDAKRDDDRRTDGQRAARTTATSS